MECGGLPPLSLGEASFARVKAQASLRTPYGFAVHERTRRSASLPFFAMESPFVCVSFVGNTGRDRGMFRFLPWSKHMLRLTCAH